MYKPIDYNLLNQNNACTPQMDLVKKHFGLKPIPLTKTVVSKLSYLFDIDWIAKKLLSEKDFRKYKKVMKPALKKYMKADDKAMSEHESVTNLAWKKYEKVVKLHGNSNQSLKKYEKDHQQAYVDYNTKCKLARAEYRKVIALEFIEIYKKGMA